MAKIISTNPSKNYEVIGEVEVASEKEIIDKVKKAREATEFWSELTVKERCVYLEKVYQKFDERREEMGKLIATEMGMPISVIDAMEVGSGLEYFKWYLENSEQSLAPDVTHEDETQKHTVYYEPMGVAAVIAPWNFPFSNFIWAAIPNLVAGNTVIFKHSEECPLFGKMIEEIFEQAKFPDGVFSEIYGDGKVGDFLVHQDIDLISFTGSTKVGQHLYQVAAEKFIPVRLELGGSAPGIVFEDVNLDKVIESIYFNRFYNSGQVCDGLKRLIVHESKFGETVKKLSEILEKKKVGDPTDQTTDIGPLVAKRQVDLLTSQIDDSVKQGAKIAFKSKMSADLKGAFYAPIILTNIKTDMRVWKEEVFGPVLPIITFKTEEEAITLANDTDYGLGGYLFTEDKEKADRVAKKIKTGMISVNNTMYLNPADPWGGFKKSSVGRGNGKFGLREVSQIKIVATEK